MKNLVPFVAILFVPLYLARAAFWAVVEFITTRPSGRWRRTKKDVGGAIAFLKLAVFATLVLPAMMGAWIGWIGAIIFLVRGEWVEAAAFGATTIYFIFCIVLLAVLDQRVVLRRLPRWMTHI